MVRYRSHLGNVKIGLKKDDWGSIGWTAQVKELVNCHHCLKNIKNNESANFCESCGYFFCLDCKAWMIENHWCRSQYQYYTIYNVTVILSEELEEDDAQTY
jgi:hypothetical protein